MRTLFILFCLVFPVLFLGCGTGAGGLGGLTGGSGSSSGNGSIAISADTGCRLYIDGVRVGTTNTTVSRSPGTYFVEGRDSAGSTRWSVNASVSAGLTTRVTQSLFCR